MGHASVLTGSLVDLLELCLQKSAGLDILLVVDLSLLLEALELEVSAPRLSLLDTPRVVGGRPYETCNFTPLAGLGRRPKLFLVLLLIVDFIHYFGGHSLLRDEELLVCLARTVLVRVIVSKVHAVDSEYVARPLLLEHVLEV